MRYWRTLVGASAIVMAPRLTTPRPEVCLEPTLESRDRREVGPGSPGKDRGEADVAHSGQCANRAKASAPDHFFEGEGEPASNLGDGIRRGLPRPSRRELRGCSASRARHVASVPSAASAKAMSEGVGNSYDQ